MCGLFGTMSGSEPTIDLAARTILITGGSLGIGRAVAERCAAAGARIVVCARTERDVEAARDALERACPRGHLGWALDVSSAEQVRAVAERVRRELGAIDGLVNAAGVIGPIGTLATVSMGDVEKTMAINFLGTVAMCQALLPLISARPRRKIVNFSGGGSTAPFPRYSAYAASKVAVVRFTENLAIEAADALLDVNAVAPGFVATRMHEETLRAGAAGAGAEYLASTEKQLASGGVPPEKAAALTAWLLSPGSDGITGKLISAPWDPWTTPELQERLRTDKDFATLRRIDDKYFGKRGP